MAAMKKTVNKSKKSKKSEQLYCKKCGLVVTVNTECDCVNVCDLICCGEQLKPKK